MQYLPHQLLLSLPFQFVKRVRTYRVIAPDTVLDSLLTTLFGLVPVLRLHLACAVPVGYASPRGLETRRRNQW